MDIFDLMSRAQKEEPVQGFDKQSDGEKILEEFNSSTLEVGDYVVRNKFGKERYKFPRDNQVARIVKIFDDYQIDGGDAVYNAIMQVALTPTEVRMYPIDIGCFSKRGEAKNVFSLFKDKK